MDKRRVLIICEDSENELLSKVCDNIKYANDNKSEIKLLDIKDLLTRYVNLSYKAVYAYISGYDLVHYVHTKEYKFDVIDNVLTDIFIYNNKIVIYYHPM